MKSVLDAKKAELKEKSAKDENRTFDLNPAVEIPKETFEKSLEAFAKQLENNNKMNLASIIRNGRSELEHNRWTYIVKDELYRDLVSREDGLLPFLRENLEVPDLFVEYQIDSGGTDNEQSMPYTDDQKLREMAKENPALDKLQEIFKTRIIY